MRRRNKEANKKTKQMCQALARFENAKALPMLEGELAAMPGTEMEIDDDFELDNSQKSTGKKGKSKSRRSRCELNVD